MPGTERLVEASSSDGVTIEFGGHMSLIFRDPDGFIACPRAGLQPA